MSLKRLGTAGQARDALGLPDVAEVWILVATGRLVARRDDGEERPWVIYDTRSNDET